MTRKYDNLFILLRAGLGSPGPAASSLSGRIDWLAVYDLASAQGVLAIAWDGLLRIAEKGLLTAVSYRFNHLSRTFD